MRPHAIVSFAVICVFLATSAVPAHSQTYSVLYNFGTLLTDPASPVYPGIIAQGRDGNLYTTITAGAVSGRGAVIKMTPGGAMTHLYDFDGTHGRAPYGGLTLGTDGNFYGTTFAGGGNDFGTIFKITPDGTLTTLHSFTNGKDGSEPYGPPIQGADGNWYGTAGAGGAHLIGTVYKITPSGTFTTLYEFDLPHGDNPRGPLVLGADGNFYGTTQFGGSIGWGVVFKITPAGKLTVVYNFDKPHGVYPIAAVIQAKDGNLYGTTMQGQTLNYGEVFKVTPAGILTVLHLMDSTNDGKQPVAGLVQASDSNLYGVNTIGTGSGSLGTLFKVTPTGTFSVVHNFTGTDGKSPQVTLFQHTNGILYGDTNSGGTGALGQCAGNKCGTFYSFDASLPKFVTPLPTFGKVGSKIGILGQGFSSASVVKFNGVKSTTVTLTGTTYLETTVPTGASDGFITVTTGAITLKSQRKFIVHNSWGSGAPMPTARAGGAVGVIGAKIYVVSGETTSAIVANNEIYNATANTWTTGASIPTPRYVPASAVVKGILYVMGGITDSSQTPSNMVEAYDPVANTWSPKAAMPTATDSANAVVEGGFIYVVGGFANGARSALVQRYDPATDTWTSEASLTTAKSSSVLALLGTTIVSAGGLPNTGNPSGDNEGYNATTNAWTALTADPTPRNAGCGAAVSGQLYVTGGSTLGLSGNATVVTESYNLSKNAWTTVLPAPLATIGALPAVANSQLFCFGGTDDGRLFNGQVYNNTQIYQP